jgi:hypothetical protein
MDTIIAGRFETYAAARQAEAVLKGSDFTANDICTFYVNPPGQHGAYPLGGDEYADKDARKADDDAGKGAALGGAVGVGAGIAAGAAAAAAPAAAAAAVVGAAGAGAYTGSLAGALHGLGDDENKQDAAAPSEPRKAGVLVAVRAEDDSAALNAREIFKQSGASDVEIAQGTWRDGQWADFDPTAAPVAMDPR